MGSEAEVGRARRPNFLSSVISLKHEIESDSARSAVGLCGRVHRPWWGCHKDCDNARLLIEAANQ